MLEEIVKIVKEKSAETLKGNTTIPNEMKDSFVTETATGIFNSLKGTNGEFSFKDIVTKFGAGDSKIMDDVIGKTTTHLQQKLNIGSEVSSPIIKSMMPMIVDTLKGKASGGLKDVFSKDKIKSMLS